MNNEPLGEAPAIWVSQRIVRLDITLIIESILTNVDRDW